jgi:hypothetical protein
MLTLEKLQAGFADLAAELDADDLERSKRALQPRTVDVEKRSRELRTNANLNISRFFARPFEVPLPRLEREADYQEIDWSFDVIRGCALELARLMRAGSSEPWFYPELVSWEDTLAYWEHLPRSTDSPIVDLFDYAVESGAMERIRAYWIDVVCVMSEQYAETLARSCARRVCVLAGIPVEASPDTFYGDSERAEYSRENSAAGASPVESDERLKLAGERTKKDTLSGIYQDMVQVAYLTMIQLWRYGRITEMSKLKKDARANAARHAALNGYQVQIANMYKNVPEPKHYSQARPQPSNHESEAERIEARERIMARLLQASAERGELSSVARERSSERERDAERGAKLRGNKKKSERENQRREAVQAIQTARVNASLKASGILGDK